MMHENCLLNMTRNYLFKEDHELRVLSNSVKFTIRLSLETIMHYMAAGWAVQNQSVFCRGLWAMHKLFFFSFINCISLVIPLI